MNLQRYMKLQVAVPGNNFDCISFIKETVENLIQFTLEQKSELGLDPENWP